MNCQENTRTHHSLFNILYQPTRKPTPKPQKQKGGNSICTYSPDYKCYKNGWPSCCDKGKCPSFPTMCDNNASGFTGGSICTWGPDYACWPDTNGRPPCCSKSGGAELNCPKSEDVEKYQPCQSAIETAME